MNARSLIYFCFYLFAIHGMAEASDWNNLLSCRQANGVSDLCVFEQSGKNVVLKDAISVPGLVFIDYDLTSCKRKFPRASAIKIHSVNQSGLSENQLVYSSKGTFGPFDNTSPIYIVDSVPANTRAEAFNGECSLQLSVRDETFKLFEANTNKIISDYMLDKDDHELAMLSYQALMFEAAGLKNGLYCLIKSYQNQDAYSELVEGLISYFNTQFDEDYASYPGVCPVVVDVRQMIAACRPTSFSQFCTNQRAYAAERQWFENARAAFTADVQRYRAVSIVIPEALKAAEADSKSVLTEVDSRFIQ